MKINEFIHLTQSKIHSNGVFASKFIPKGTKIIEYTGELISKEEGTKRSTISHNEHKKDSSKGGVYIFDIDEEHDLDGNTENNYAKYINHSCEPNCEFDGEGKKIWVNSIKDIQKNEELSINYGFVWDEKDYHDHPCLCGSKKCIGYILDEDDWPKLKKHLKKLKNRN
jgi:SET domain-containing protein